MLFRSAVNDAPVLSELGNQTTAEDTDLEISLSVTDDDESDTHTYTVSGGVNITASISGNSLIFEPSNNFNGSETFTVTVADNGTPSLTDSESVTVTVTAVNDAPTLEVLSNVEVNEDSDAESQTLTVSDEDDGFDSLNFEILSSDGTLFSELAVVTANGLATLKMQFKENANGVSTVEVIEIGRAHV